MKLYGAIDLHSNNNVTVLIDEQDQVVYQKRLPNELGLITEQLSAYRDRLQGIVVEISFLGQKDCQGREQTLFERFSHALILMGDWCGPKSDTDRKENRGA